MVRIRNEFTQQKNVEMPKQEMGCFNASRCVVQCKLASSLREQPRPSFTSTHASPPYGEICDLMKHGRVWSSKSPSGHATVPAPSLEAFSFCQEWIPQMENIGQQTQCDLQNGAGVLFIFLLQVIIKHVVCINIAYLPPPKVRHEKACHKAGFIGLLWSIGVI